MNDGVLYTARRTMITRKFVGCILALIFGVITLILGFVLMGMGSGDIFIFIGLFIALLGGIAALFEGLTMRSNKIEFYKNKYIIKSGLINKHEDEAILTNLVSVSVNQSLGGRMFDYGTVRINIVGKKDISLSGVKHPQKLKKYIQALLDNTNVNNIKQVIHD